jgi:serine protease Do
MVGGGLGFAIPSRIVRQFLEDLRGPREQAYLGIEVLTVPLGDDLQRRAGLEQDTAAMITAVVADSPAEAAGLLPGDVVLALDGTTIRDARHLPRLLGSGETSVRSRTVTILRGGVPQDVALTPALLRQAA